MDARFVLVLGTCALVACQSGLGDRDALGDLEIVPASLDFGTILLGEQATRVLTVSNAGTLPLGISRIALGQDELAASFSLAYDFAEVHCKEGAPESEGQVLDHGCSVPVHVTMTPQALGPVAAAVEVLTADDPATDPRYSRDPDELSGAAIVLGHAHSERPRIHVEPAGVDFGFVWIGETAYRQVEVTNIGSAPLTVGGVELPSEYDDQFRLVDPDPTGRAIDPGGSVLVQIAFSPQTVEQVRDQPDTWMRILSDDVDVPETDVRLLANQAGTEEDERPRASLVSPPPGTSVVGATLELELDVQDANQPASSLSCRVMSAHLLKAPLADCAAAQDDGHVAASVPTKLLEPGVDTIAVEVWDAFGLKTIATTSILYSTPPPANDADGDGYADALSGGEDCDDHDAAVYPGAAETPDGRDNGCEAICTDAVCGGVTMSSCVDEGTTLGDADADCFVEDPKAANGGDCNDNDPATYPGAADTVDYRDNDCDGEIDEVVSHDDLDGDGFSPWAGDCDDADATFGPAAVELCDGDDQNCDGIIDDACLPVDTDPVLVGGLRPERSDIGVGETVAIEAFGFDPDGDPMTFAWTQDSALSGVALVGADGVATFTAPMALPDGEESVTYELMVQVSGDAGPGDWAFGYVTVHSAPVELTRGARPVESGCGESGGVAAALLLPAAFLARARRRHSHPRETSR
jgi:hypothetical protein